MRHRESTLYARAAGAGGNQAPSLHEVELRARERHNLRGALEQASGNISRPGGAARLFGVKPTSLVSRIRTLGLRRNRT